MAQSGLGGAFRPPPFSPSHPQAGTSQVTLAGWLQLSTFWCGRLALPVPWLGGACDPPLAGGL